MKFITARNLRQIFVVLLLLSVFALPAEENRDAAFFKYQGDAERVQNNTLAAIEYYRKSLQKNSGYVPALVAMGSLQREIGDLKVSAEYLNQAFKLEPKNEDVLLELAETSLAARADQTARNLAEAGLKISSHRPEFQFVLARIYVNEGRYSLAQKKLEQILRAAPQHYPSNILLGELLVRQRRFDKAREFFEKARLIQSDNPDIFIRLASIRLLQILDEKKDILFSEPVKMQSFQPVLALLENARAFNAYYVPANFMLGQIYALGNDCSKARTFLEGVLQINPDHRGALYLTGYCDQKQSIGIYSRMLQANSNDEILRFSLEWNLLASLPRREHPQILRQVREHMEFARALGTSNYLQSIYETRWAAFLFPGYEKAHAELMQYYRSQNDMPKYQLELDFLRRAEKRNQEKSYYQDLYEQMVSKRREKFYYEEGIADPVRYRSSTPLLVFYFQPENAMGEYPDAGRAIAEKLNFALQDYGRLKPVDHDLRQSIFSDILKLNYFGLGGYYSAQAATLAKKAYQGMLDGQEVSLDIDEIAQPQAQPLRYAVAGSYREIPGGLAVKMHLVDMKTGETFAEASFSATGRGFLRVLSLRLASHIYNQIPFRGYVLKISQKQIVINLGTRDGLGPNDLLQVSREGNVISRLKIVRLDKDILLAQPEKEADLLHIQTKDEVTLASGDSQQP